MSPKQTEKNIHLCYDCVKAADESCEIYESITKVIEDNFDEVKILFEIPECEYFIPENEDDKNIV